MLLLNRRDAAAKHENTKTEDIGWGLWKKGMSKRSLMDLLNGKMKSLLLKTFFKKSWGKYREMPEIAPKSFAKQWEEAKKNPEA
jgi:L-lactate dehydrogenase complex protein LldF